ncbi:MAG: hypothetical protein ACC650_07185 [Gammaproteobacteria bacterium]
MLLRTRTNIFFYYRLFFIALFLLLGISGTGIVVLDYYAGITIIETGSPFDKQALFATLSIMGTLGFFMAFIMIFLMREKRDSIADRREISKPLDFIDRRSNIDRRSL